MRRNWTDEEEEYLISNIGYVKIPTIAEKLNRTIPSVELKMRRLGIRNTLHQYGVMTIGELAELIKVDRTVVKLWTKKHGLKVNKRIISRKRQHSFIQVEDFWEWAKENKDRVDFKQIEPLSILPEPEWVKEARKHNPEYKKKEYKTWTIKEDNRLLELLHGGLTYKEISQRMDRTPVSVARRHDRIRKGEVSNLHFKQSNKYYH